MQNIETIFEENYEAVEHSFLRILHEDETWNHEKYWELDHAMVVCAKNNREQTQLNRELCAVAARIYINILGLVSAHYDENDFFRIKNLSDEEVFDFREKTELRFEHFYSGEVLTERLFRQKNPLIIREFGEPDRLG